MGLLGPISLMCPLRLSAFSTRVPSLHPFEVSPSPEMHMCAWEPPRTDSHGWMWQVGWGLCTHWGLCPLGGGRPLFHFPPADYTAGNGYHFLSCFQERPGGRPWQSSG